ncbi:MAG: FAD-dependent oxidoreductase, partial [Kangiellaceae bacterium]|nr:FAD-dependent oxidoreductase [Kangiellaceae bacterium]
MRSNQSDIIIVGGGMVGLAMAAALADTGLSIKVLEKNKLSELSQTALSAQQKISPADYQIRVSAISPANQRFLRELNCWQQIPSSRIANYERMFVWDADGSGQIQFDAAEIGAPYLGAIVENQLIQAAIYFQLQRCSNIEIIENCRIKSLVTNNEVAEVVLADETRLGAHLIIGADGAFSSVRQLVNISCSQSPYQQTAFVANLLTEKPHQNTAWQRFLRTGPLAFLPLQSPNLCSIVWTLDQSETGKIENLDKIELEKKISRAFENKLGGVQLVSEFRGFPLIKRHADRYLS